MNKNVIAFRKGLRIFWEQEFMPVARELAPIIRPVLAEISAFIKAVIFVSWVVFPYCFLIAGLKNRDTQLHHLVYYGAAGIISQVIAVMVMFIRHVLRLGSK